MKIAAIDIGSNAARLLINEVKNLKRKARIRKTESSENSFRLGIDVLPLAKLAKKERKWSLNL